MAKNSVLGKPSTISHLPKQGFNMSQKLKFTSATGQLLPVYFDFLHPGEKVKFSCDLFTRTQPLQTAAMVDIDEYVDLFFVPIKKLYSPAPELLMGIDDFNSTALDLQTLKENTEDWFIPQINFNRDIWRRQSLAADYMPGSQAYVRNGEAFDNFYAGAMRLFDMFGINPYIASSPIGVSDDFVYEGEDVNGHEVLTMTAINPMYLLAYQAIYFDYYRISSWETNNPYCYNLDNCKTKDALDNLEIRDYLRNFMELRYRPYQRDYFKMIEPSPIVNSIGMAGYNYNFVNEDLKLDVAQGSGGSTFADGVALYRGQTVVQEDPDVQSLKQSFAMQKLLAITGRAGKHYDDQVLAHYGFKVPRMGTNEVYFLGSHHQQIHIGEVISTADTSSAGGSNGSPLGQIAGKGYGKGVSDDINFTAPYHGVIMAIYSCVPKINYISNIDKLHTAVSRFDLYVPELDKLGMQPLFSYEIANTPADESVRILGWQYRYMPYKKKYDRVTNAFFKSYTSDGVSSGPFSDWTLEFHSFSLQYPNGQQRITYSDFYCVPWALDQIMLVGYGDIDYQGLGYFKYWRSELYATDPLIHDLFIKCFKISSMSTFGVDDLSTI